jgi:hypothetical protein
LRKNEEELDKERAKRKRREGTQERCFFVCGGSGDFLSVCAQPPHRHALLSPKPPS